VLSIASISFPSGVMSFREVGKESELWVGELRQVRVDERSVLLLRTDAGVFAYEDRCPHLGVPLSQGALEGCKLTCAAHHYQYDACTGRGINPRNVSLRAYPVRCQAGAIFVEVADSAAPGASNHDEVARGS
jgi:toluene monooxygenase system ferredoxin subunit